MNESELSLQGMCYQWAYNSYPEVRGILHHIPNGGKRTKQEAAQLRASGVVKGVLDLFLPMVRRGYCGLYIEMKLPGEKLRTEQLQFAAKVSSNGYGVYRCDSFDGFRQLLEWYLGIIEEEPINLKVI